MIKGLLRSSVSIDKCMILPTLIRLGVTWMKVSAATFMLKVVQLISRSVSDK